MAYKLAAFRSMFSRAYTHITRWRNRKAEVDYIFTQGHKYGYTFKVLNGLWSKVSESVLSVQQATLPTQPGLDTRPCRDIVYDVTLYKILNKALKHGNHRIAWKRGAILFNSLRNEKDNIPKDRKAGVYSIPICSNDDDRMCYYICSTARNLSKRINEHKNDIITGKLSTALAIMHINMILP